MKKGLILGLGLFLLILPAVLAPEVAEAADDILIGNASSLTGTAAQYGISTYEGLEVAMEEINAAGGILGKKISDPQRG